MKIHGIDHVEYYVADLEKTAEGLCGSYGFRLAGRSAASSGKRSVLLQHGQIKMLLTAPAAADDPVATYLARHGDGIAARLAIVAAVDEPAGAILKARGG